jgi:hypothetical protein
MSRGWLLGIVLACHGVVTTTQAQAPDPLPLALIVTHADGRVTEAAITARVHRAWTPYFPRVTGWQDPPGVLPVRALDTRAVRDGDVVHVTISVLRGESREVEEPIAAAALRLDETTTIDALRRVGLMPVTLAVKPFVAPALHVPQASSIVDGLVIEAVEPVSDPVPAYRVTLRNMTDTPAVTVAFTMFSQGQRHLSGQQGNPSAEPIVAPGGTYTFNVRLRGGGGRQVDGASAIPIDDVRITGAVWADGRRAGDPARSRDMLAVHTGRLTALDAIVGVVRDAAARSADDPSEQVRRVAAAVADIPTTPEALAIAGVLLGASLGGEAFSQGIAAGSADVRRRLADDLTRVTTTMTPDEARQWLSEAVAAIEAWRQRLAPIVGRR